MLLFQHHLEATCTTSKSQNKCKAVRVTMVFVERSTFFRCLLHCTGGNSLFYLLSKGKGLNFLSKIGGWSLVKTPGGNQQMFIRGGSAPRSNHLSFGVLFFTKKVPLSNTLFRTFYPSTAVNALSFKQESVTKIERFFDFIKP